MTFQPCPNPHCTNDQPPDGYSQHDETFGDWIYGINCTCGVSGPWGETPEEAERLWNDLPREGQGDE